MKAARILALILGGGSLLIISQIALSARLNRNLEPEDHETTTLSFFGLQAEAREPVDAEEIRMARLHAAQHLPFQED